MTVNSTDERPPITAPEVGAESSTEKCSINEVAASAFMEKPKNA